MLARDRPALFPRLRGAIDEDRRRNGRFLILGSVSPSLMIQVSESLAGRLSLVELTPFLLEELDSRRARERHGLCGGYPDGGVLEPRRFPQKTADRIGASRCFLVSRTSRPAEGERRASLNVASWLARLRQAPGASAGPGT